jgi:outer membrane protein assembly factor BamA
MTLNFPIYPLIYARYKNVPTRLYWGDGRIITTYKDRSFSFGGGLGFLLKKSLNLELTYELEKMNIKSQAEFAPLESSSALKHTLRKIELAATLDTLDDRRAPKNGLLFRGLYEGSYESLGSEAAFERAEASLDIYRTLREKNTVRVYGYWGTSRGDVPFYKQHNQGRPATFVGMAYDQLQGNTMKIVRADYSYSFTNRVQFKFMANVALGLKQRRPDVIYSPGTLWGMGTGIVINTPLGLLELTYGLGSKGLGDPSTLQSVAYLELGARF